MMIFASQKKGAPRPFQRGDAPDGSNVRSIRRPFDHRLQPFDHAGFDEHARQAGRYRRVEYRREHFAFQVSQPARSVRLFRHQTISARWRAAALRITFDHRDETVIEESLVFGAQAPARRRAVLHARAQASIEQDAASIEGHAADQAGVLFKRNVRFLVHGDLRLLGRNCPEPSPARRSASRQGSQTAMAASVQGTRSP